MITEATTNDIKNIVDLVNIAYRSKTLQGWTSESDIIVGNRINAEQVQQLFTEYSKIFLLYEQQTLIGCVNIQQRDHACYIGMLTTHPAAQNKGIGTQLLQFAEQFAIQNNKITTFKMSVLSPRTELIEYYQRRGYQLTGEIDAYPIDANVGQPLRDDLQLLYLQKQV